MLVSGRVVCFFFFWFCLYTVWGLLPGYFFWEFLKFFQITWTNKLTHPHLSELDIFFGIKCQVSESLILIFLGDGTQKVPVRTPGNSQVEEQAALSYSSSLLSFGITFFSCGALGLPWVGQWVGMQLCIFEGILDLRCYGWHLLERNLAIFRWLEKPVEGCTTIGLSVV